MPEAVLSLGSNQGDREGNLRSAVRLISKGSVVEAVSSVYETEPMYVEEQPLFLNCVVVVETALPPLGLLRRIQDVETEMGRQRTIRYGPRTIDIDIVFYSELVVAEPALEVPHPGLAERAFVLVPLAEVRPDLVHPVLKKTVVQLLAEVESAKSVRKLGPLNGLDA